MKIQSVAFAFENCDLLTINGKYIDDLLITDVNVAIRKMPSGDIIREDLIAGTVALKINKKANHLRYQFDMKGEDRYKQMVFERLAQKDIVIVEITVDEENGKPLQSYEYYVNWPEDIGLINKLQQTYADESKNLYVIISNRDHILGFT